MKYLTVTIALCVCLGVVLSAPTSFDEDQPRDFNAIVALLPVYGHIKLKNIFTQKSINLVKKFFVDHPQHYTNIKNALAAELVFYPTLENMNWNFMTPSNWVTLDGILGETTIKTAMYDTQWQQNFETNVLNHPEIILSAEQTVLNMGITFGNFDINSAFEVFKQAHNLILADFLPTAIQIFLGASGKRQLPTLPAFPPALISMIKAFLAGSSPDANALNTFLSQNNIPVDTFLSHLGSGTLGTIMTPTILANVETFMSQNASLIATIAGVLAEFGLLPGKRQLPTLY